MNSYDSSYIEILNGLGNALPLQMLLIPSGRFLMGSPEDEPEREDCEGSQHEVNISNFFMSRYPITQAQWKAVSMMPQVKRELEIDNSRFEGENRPIESIMWEDAVEFCARLTKYTTYCYRLPSEAEWEYACRAGTKTPYYFGNIITPEVANYNGSYTYNDSPKGEFRRETTPVDHFNVANDFGLSDMHGNVWEWCQDHGHYSYEGAPTDGSAWLDSQPNEEHILRGGSWHDHPRFCRSAYRLKYTLGYDNIGFRICSSASNISR
jgi:formylglycine-generating enzyme required for sulfatase activity